MNDGIKEQAGKVVNETVQTLPPVFITSTNLAGITWQNWVYILTALYTAIQIVRLLPRIWGCIVCLKKHGYICKGSACKMQ